MKKAYGSIIFTLAIIIFINMASAVVINGTCLDSDKGVKYNEKGEAEGNWLTNRTDYVYAADECKDDKKTLVEYYCDENFLYSLKHKCPNFCQEGVCVKELAAESEISIKEEINSDDTNNLSIVNSTSSINSSNIIQNITKNNINETNKSIIPSNNFIEISEENKKDNSKEQTNSNFIEKIINWIKSIFSSKA